MQTFNLPPKPDLIGKQMSTLDGKTVGEVTHIFWGPHEQCWMVLLKNWDRLHSFRMDQVTEL